MSFVCFKSSKITRRKHLFLFFFTSLFCLGMANAQVTEEFDDPGTGTWTVPAGVTEITVKAWGAGGGSGGHGTTSGNAGVAGGTTTFEGNGTDLSAGGGLGSAGATNNTPTAGGDGGVATGGITNIHGTSGTAGSVGNPSFGGNGGGSPNGGGNQDGPEAGNNDSENGINGNAPGGGAAGSARGRAPGQAQEQRSTGGGGGGAYVEIILMVSPGDIFDYAVGEGGFGGTGNQGNGGAGADGKIEITYTVAACDLSADVDYEEPNCFGGDDGSITISNPTGAVNYDYSIDGGDNWQSGNTFTGLEAGSYEVFIRDADDVSCTEDLGMVTVGQPSLLEIDLDELEDETCPDAADGSIEVSAAGGNSPYSFEWSTMETGQTIDNLTAGSYSVTVSDDNDCTAIETYQVNTSFSNPTADASNNGPYCLNGTIELFATGGTSYSWEGPNGFSSMDQNPTIPNATLDMADTYTLTVIDGNGCSDEATTTVVVIDDLTDFTATNITSESADLSWISSVVDFEIEWGESGFAQGTGNLVSTTDNPYTLSGLGPSTAYECYVRQGCGGGTFSDWIGPVTFTTALAAGDILMYLPNGDRVLYLDFFLALDDLPASAGLPGSGGLLRVTDPDTGDWTFYTKDETDALFELTLTKDATETPGPSGIWVPSVYSLAPPPGQ